MLSFKHFGTATSLQAHKFHMLS